MKITRINIDVFGGLRNFRAELSGGVNIIEGANEAGKSSLASFIKFVFFGLSGRGKDNAPSERMQWLNWDEGRAAGWLELDRNGQLLRVERSAIPAARGAVHDSCRVIDATTGDELKLEPQSLCGMPEELFVRTAYVRQSDGKLFDGGDVGEAVNNLLFSADENINVQKSIKKLDEARCVLLYKNKRGGLIFELERERDELTEALSASSSENSELIAKEATVAELTRKAEANRARLAEIRTLIARYENGIISKASRRTIELERKRSQLAGRETELREKLSYNGFMPDDAYLRSLVAAAGSFDAAEKSEAELNSELERLRGEETDHEEKRHRIDDVRSRGGKAALSDKVMSCQAKSRSLKAFGVILVLLAVICGVGFVLLRGINSMISIGCAFAALVLAFAAVMCFFASSKATGEARSILEHFGVSNQSELNAALDGAAEDETRLKYIAERESGLCERISTASALTAQKRDELEALLGRWGRKLDSTPSECIATVERDAADCSEAISSAQREREKCEAALESLKIQLNRYSSEELEARLSDAMDEAEMESVKPAELERERDFLEKAAAAQAERISELERRVAALRVSAKSPAAIADRLTVIDARLSRLKLKHDALMLACDALGRAGDRLRETVAPRLAEEAGGYMGEVTGGRYPKLGVSASLELTVMGDNVRSVELLSSGTQDSAYLSLRIALLRLLGGTDTPPMIFDESFSRLDDARLSRMLALISAASRSGLQSLILTSQLRDAALAPPGCNVIRL